MAIKEILRSRSRLDPSTEVLDVVDDNGEVTYVRREDLLEPETALVDYKGVADDPKPGPTTSLEDRPSYYLDALDSLANARKANGRRTNTRTLSQFANRIGTSIETAEAILRSKEADHRNEAQKHFDLLVGRSALESAGFVTTAMYSLHDFETAHFGSTTPKSTNRKARDNMTKLQRSVTAIQRIPLE